MKDKGINFWVDSHVHIYSVFDIDDFFDSALNNLLDASQLLAKEQNELVLFITEGINENTRQRLDAHSGRWVLDADENGFIARNQQHTLTLITGQQLVSAEGLELLVLGEPWMQFSPRLPIQQYLQSVQQGLVILPWGFGKWLGKRGDLMLELIGSQEFSSRFMLGDIPARLNILGGRHQFNLAHQQSIPILRGTDPLPLANEQHRPGCFGTKISIPSGLNLHGSITTNVLNCIKQICTENRSTNNADTSISQFGNKLPITQNLLSQFQLRLSK